MNKKKPDIKLLRHKLPIQDKYNLLLKDTCDDDTEIRRLARPLLGDWVDGNSNYVPNIVDIVEKLIERINLLDALNDGERETI